MKCAILLRAYNTELNDKGSMTMVTKEEVDKAKAYYYAAANATAAVSYDYDYACDYAADAVEAADEAWNKYIKLKLEYDNGN